MSFRHPSDPLEMELEPGGQRVGDLMTREQCAAAVARLNTAIDSIIAQIGNSEIDPTSKPAGWRTKAQSAIRWKKRLRGAVNAHAATLDKGLSGRDDRSKAILDTIRAELGAGEFERLVALAKGRNPSLFGTV
jgi:hypothetical protein